jgi:formylmethanofuran dehydrogenase subunit C
MSVLTLRHAPPERLDLSGITPDRLAGLSEAEAARLPVGTSRLGLVLGDCFSLALDGGEELRLAGGSDRLDRVGEALAGGTITVEGDVGQRLGAGMRAGTIRVSGSAGPFAGTGAKGGLIAIAGDAGASAGGAVHGAMGGLGGATLVIGGRAGDRLGDRMRGGLIVAERAGDLAGARMVAGTLVAGTIGDHPGYGMRRGTVLVERHGALLPTFVETGTQDLVFLRLLAKALDALALDAVALDPRFAALARAPLARRAGDLATLGKGELFTPLG